MLYRDGGAVAAGSGTPVEIVFRVDDAVFRCEAASRMMRTKGAGFLFANQSAKAQGELERLIRSSAGKLPLE